MRLGIGFLFVWREMSCIIAIIKKMLTTGLKKNNNSTKNIRVKKSARSSFMIGL